jgi:hypothetical protein
MAMYLHDMTAQRERFTAYYQTFARRFPPGSEHVEHLHLKWEHSLKVLENVESIMSASGMGGVFTPELTRGTQLAALYHDVARFEQYVAYHTFRDAESANHGLWGVKIIKKGLWLAEESPRVTAFALAGVSIHNRFAIPRGVPEDCRLLAGAVRDADKLDILRVICGYAQPGGKRSSVVTWKLADAPEKWTPSLYNAVLSKRLGRSEDMRYINDFRLLICSWVYDINFPSSRALMRKQGYLDEILAGLPSGQAMNRLRDTVSKALRD